MVAIGRIRCDTRLATKNIQIVVGYAAQRAAPPFRISMLGGSEFRLRRGFACGKTLVRRISAAGQKAGWVVACPLHGPHFKYRF